MVMNYGIRLREARKRAGLTQEELAARAKVSQSTITNIERGRYLNSRHTVALAQVLGVDPVFLETGKESRIHSSREYITEIMEIYRALPPKFQKALLDDARRLMALQDPDT